MLDLGVSISHRSQKLRYACFVDLLDYSMLPDLYGSSRDSHLHVVLVFNILYAVLGDNLDEDTLEVNRKTSLEFFCAHPHDLETLLVVDIRVMMLV